MNTVAKNIKRLRAENKITQDELAEKMYVTRQTISNWENGKNQPDIDTLDTLATILGTDINEIIYGNKKSEYPKYQKRYIKITIAAILILIILTVIYLTLIPYLMELKARTYKFALETVIINIGSIVAIYFCIGFCIFSVLSLWFNCSVKSSKRYLLFALVAVAPVILILFEYIFFKFISDQTPMYLLSAMAGSWQWLEPVVTRILPAVSGALTFLYHNIKKEEL